jgi:putative ABC transport system substrate-binding protein
MAIYIGRRDFIVALGGATVTRSLDARAQQSPTPFVGFVSSRSPHESAYLVSAFRQGLKEGGYIEGQNITIEYRWAEGKYDQLSALAADLVRHRVAAIVSAGGMVTALAVKAATATIPIVFISAGIDPVKAGLVASINRPGGNVTGVNMLSVALEAKRMQLLHELVPKAALVAILINPKTPDVETEIADLEAAANTIGWRTHVEKAETEGEFETAFEAIVRNHADALVVAADPFFTSRRERLTALAARYAIPTIYEFREYAAAGGLISYGTSLADGYRQAGAYAGRILKGAKPADLPVMQPTKFELVINLKTAKALGLEVPLHIQQLADEVIE